MNAILIRSMTLAVAVLAVPLHASAQTFGTTRGAEEIDEVRREARSHLGPIYVTPTILLKELGVDSNVFNAAGEQKSDFTFTVGPKVDLWVPVARRALLQGTAATDLVWYAQYDSERSVDPQFALRGEVYLRRVTLFASGQYVNTRQRLNYEVDVRARHLENGANAGVAVRLTPKLSIEAATLLERTRFDSDAVFDGVSLQKTLNQDTTGFSVTGRHHITPLTTLALRYERLKDEFEYSPIRDSNSVRVMPGVEFKPRALITGTAYVGYRRFTPSATRALREFTGLVAQLGLSYTLLGSTTMGVSYSRDLTYSYEVEQPFFINNSVGVSVRRAIGRRFDIIVSTDRHQYVYQDVLVETTPREDVTWNYTGTFGYRIGNGRIGFGASYWQRESPTQSFRDYDNLRFGTTVTYGF
jgi:hypothetical protein